MKNIVLIVVDTLRPDHLGCYGYRRPTSPRLDALAAEGTVLENVWSASNFTAPAFTSLFTGLHPHEHGVFDFHVKATGSRIFQALQAAGVRTGGTVAFRFFGNLLERVWGPVEAVTDGRTIDYGKDMPLAVSEGGLEWLDANAADGPFCLFLHYDGPHMPFRLPDEYATMFDSFEPAGVDPELVDVLFPQDRENLAEGGYHPGPSIFRIIKSINWGRRRLSPDSIQWVIDKYDAAVRYNDAAVGVFLDGLQARGLADDTVVCVLSDHGEAFCEHGSFSHGGNHLYEEIVRTVGIVRDPGRPQAAGGRLAQPVGHVDVLPTLMALAGVPGGGGFAGMWSGRETGGDVFCQGKAMVALRRGNLKYIRPRPNPSLGTTARLKQWVKMALRRDLKEELFDLAADPGETRNLIGDKALAAPLRRAMDSHLQTVRREAEASSDLDEATRKRIEQEMKDLGYM